MKIDIKYLIYRKLTQDDIDLFVKLRLDFLSDINKEMTEKYREIMTDSLKQYYLKHFVKNEFIGIICEYNSNIISTAFLAISEKPANFHFINGKIGTLLNVFTYPEYRKNGISTNIMKMVLEESKKQNISEIELLATEDGEKIYKKFGFSESDNKYMKLRL
jgi:predicted GNAT family N-acyltransferase